MIIKGFIVKINKMILNKILLIGILSMPSLVNFNLELEKEIYCGNKEVILKFYEHKGIGMALSATRKGKDKPYSVMVENYGLYLDNGFNGGFAEDGFIDRYINLNREINRSVCGDIPKDINI
tara:strand:+ start:12263 stop:12628 length:366 start_codon:yes stop_codon:yes gene_type:complete